jgi:hypothetical protein
MDFADREVSLDPEDEEAVNEEFGEPGRPALQKSSNGHKRGGDFEDSSEEEDDDDDEEAARVSSFSNAPDGMWVFWLFRANCLLMTSWEIDSRGVHC